MLAHDLLLSYNVFIETKEALKMQKFIDFLMFFGEYILTVYIPVVVLSAVLSIVFGLVVWKLIIASLKCVDFLYEMKKSMICAVKDRVEISKLVRHFGRPLVQTTYYPNGRQKTRKYYF